jgi:FkbM family methyltransferase
VAIHRAACPAARDLAQYSRPSYGAASKLRQRAADRFLKALGAAGRIDADAVTLGAPASDSLRLALEHLERALPSDPLHEEFLARHTPDAVLVTPGVHFGSVQSDVVKSAQARGIPVWMLLFSWDNLSSKGALHVAPDLLFVWNERQRLEAEQLHDFPPERVVVVGAPRFDDFFTLRSQMTRRAFLEPLGLDPARPVLLYVCSSRFIAERELPFVRRWLAAVRAGPEPLRSSQVIVRPHPDVVLDQETPEEIVTWDGLSRATGWVQRSFEDAGAVILRTTFATPQAFFECLHHAAAVVGLNTSAELEAGIAGRPVLTLLSRESGADGQRSTLHFDYLLRENGGFVSCAPTMEEHVGALAATVAEPPDAAGITRFIGDFLRPCGDQPVSPLLARTLVERVTTAPPPSPAPASSDPPQEAVAAPVTATGKLLFVHTPGAAARVHVTPETRRWRRAGVLHLDPVAVAWLADRMHPGDVLYDIGAGIGAFAILAALERGGLAVAFEPGFASFSRLCDNLLLNGCYRSVIPVPAALADREGLTEMVYPHTPGEDTHALTERRWRARLDRVESRYTQPVCTDRLDGLVARQRLPAPHAVRVNVRKNPDRVLAGAADVLRQPQLRSVLVSMADAAQAESVLRAVEGLGFAHTLTPARDGFDGSLCLVRSGPVPRDPLHAVRRAVAGLRSGTGRVVRRR